MYKVIWGELQSVTETQTKTGSRVAKCVINAQGRWNSETNARDVVVTTLYYYDSDVKTDATRCLQRTFLVGRTVAAVGKITERADVYLGRDLPVSHGFCRVPPELKPADPEAIKEFNNALNKCYKFRKIQPDYTVNMGSAAELSNLYNTYAANKDPIISDLTKAVTKLFWGEKWTFIGPIGGIYSCNNGALRRISVCPYHADGPAQWADITLWNEEDSRKIAASGAKAGDIVLFDDMFRRNPYNGKQQYAGYHFHIISRK